MGKRKSAKKPTAARSLMPLDKYFRCVFCQHERTVTAKLDMKTKTGRLDCKDCGKAFQTDINHLTEPIDIYSEWIDACEKVNAEEYAKTQPAVGGRNTLLRKRPAVRNDNDDEDEEEEQQRRPRKRQVEEEEVQEKDEDDEDDLPDLSVRRKQVVEDDEEDE